jgi:hypothetical protein
MRRGIPWSTLRPLAKIPNITKSRGRCFEHCSRSGLRDGLSISQEAWSLGGILGNTFYADQREQSLTRRSGTKKKGVKPTWPNPLIFLVPEERIELSRPQGTLDFESSASTSSTTPALSRQTINRGVYGCQGKLTRRPPWMGAGRIASPSEVSVRLHLFAPRWKSRLTESIAFSSISFRRGAVAQLGERLNGIQEVRGSTPRSSTRKQ